MNFRVNMFGSSLVHAENQHADDKICYPKFCSAQKILSTCNLENGKPYLYEF